MVVIDFMIFFCFVILFQVERKRSLMRAAVSDVNIYLDGERTSRAGDCPLAIADFSFGFNRERAPRTRMRPGGSANPESNRDSM